VTNTGARAGDEVVQLYIRDDYSRVTRPVKELKGFKRVSLAPGEKRKVYFDITPEMLGYYGIGMKWQVDAGTFSIMVGGSSRRSDLQLSKLRLTPN
jgi:beta-glucosidase